jgi:hypothetical protein
MAKKQTKQEALRLTIPDSDELDRIIVVAVHGNLYLQTACYYIISLLTITLHNAHKFDDEKFRPLSSKLLEKIIGKAEYRQLKAIGIGVLFDRPEGYQTNKRCMRFRLREEFQTGRWKVVTFSGRLVKKFNKANQKKNAEYAGLEIRYQHLRQQFGTHKLSLGEAEGSLVRAVREEMDDLRRKGIPFNTDLTLSRVGIWKGYINTLAVNNSQFRPSASNHRLNTILTTLPKYLRSFLTINNKPVVEIDLRCCQPYVLACILSRHEFFNSEHGPFTCASIYPEIYEEWRGGVLPTFISDFWHTNNVTGELERFRYAVTDDFYQYLIDIGERNATWLFQDYPKLRQRSFVKEKFMLTLFDNNFNSRPRNPVTKLFNFLFPTINTFIVRFMKAFGSSKFSLLLQRVEAHLVIRVATHAVHVCNSNIPIFTIHDSILTTEEYRELVEYYVCTSIQNATNIRPLLVSRPVVDLRGNVDSLFKDTTDQKGKKNNQYTSVKKDQMRFILPAMVERGRKMIEEQSHSESKISV